MRQLLDMYLSADPSRTLSNFGDATLLQIIVQQGIEAAQNQMPEAIKRSREAIAETLEANMRKVITQEMPINPIYYERMSVLLQELIQQRKKGALDYEQFLREIEELAKKIQPENKQSQYPPNIDTPAKQALYEILEDEDLTLQMEAEVAYSLEKNWIGNTLKERKVMLAIRKHIPDDQQAKMILEVVKNQKEYR